MPIYEYVCTDCGEPVEKLQKLSDAPLTDCPACGEARLKRKVSAVGFRLSGGGWYETDFKSDNRRNLSGDKSDSSNGAAKESTSKGGESKGAASGGESQSSNSGGGESKGSSDSKKSASAGGD